MELEHFFKKDVHVFPSGKVPYDRGVKVSRHAPALLRSGLKSGLGVAAVAVLMGSCGKSYSEIDAIKSRMPEKAQKEATLSYDKNLLWKIDSLRLDEGVNMSDAVSQALDEMERQTIPADTAKWTPKDYVLSDHACRRRNEARPVKKLFGQEFRAINDDFRDDLRTDILKQEEQSGYERAVWKSVGKARLVRD